MMTKMMNTKRVYVYYGCYWHITYDIIINKNNNLLIDERKEGIK